VDPFAPAAAPPCLPLLLPWFLFLPDLAEAYIGGWAITPIAASLAVAAVIESRAARSRLSGNSFVRISLLV